MADMLTFPTLRYHGWIVRNDEGPGYRPTYRCEWTEDVADGTQNKRILFCGTNVTLAIEHFDKLVGQPVSLIETPLNAFRVFTNEHIVAVKKGGSVDRQLSSS